MDINSLVRQLALAECTTAQPKDCTVYCISKHQPLVELNSLYGVLSDEEKARLDAFHHEKNASIYGLAHAWLRLILEHHSDIPAAEIVFKKNDYGKPYVANATSRTVHFNISHSEHMALVAVSHSRQVGVDIEFAKSHIHTLELAQSCFSADEFAAIKRSPANKQNAAFFTCWSRKEAFIKAIGLGLNMPLSNFSVSVNPSEPAQLLRVEHADISAEQWQLHQLHAPKGYYACLATNTQKPV